MLSKRSKIDKGSAKKQQQKNRACGALEGEKEYKPIDFNFDFFVDFFVGKSPKP